MAPYNLRLPGPVPKGNGSYGKLGDHQENGNNKQNHRKKPTRRRHIIDISFNLKFPQVHAQ